MQEHKYFKNKTLPNFRQDVILKDNFRFYQFKTIVIILLVTAGQYESDWSAWSACSVSCAGGVKNRFRVHTCLGAEEETVSCNEQACPSFGPWDPWSDCLDICTNRKFSDVQLVFCLIQNVVFFSINQKTCVEF